MLGNKLIDFVQGNTLPKNPNDWFANKTSEEQKSIKKAVKNYNNLLKTEGPTLDIARWKQFSGLSDDVRTYLKSLDGAEASTEDLNKAL